jgi:hypothetical protein
MQFNPPAQLITSTDLTALCLECERMATLHFDLPIPDNITLVALQGAILKWTLLANGENIGSGGANCPLCHLFSTYCRYCYGCPVREHTGCENCEGTIYVTYRHDSTTENAAKMRDFLIALLPSV